MKQQHRKTVRHTEDQQKAPAPWSPACCLIMPAQNGITNPDWGFGRHFLPFQLDWRPQLGGLASLGRQHLIHKACIRRLIVPPAQ